MISYPNLDENPGAQSMEKEAFSFVPRTMRAADHSIQPKTKRNTKAYLYKAA
jgi:hypothetical protein